jgi:hypothetical protein
MSCERHKKELIAAAASGIEPTPVLRAHLNDCASCRAQFAQEQSLFAAIDASLHFRANSEPPPSLLPRVRAQMDEVALPSLGRFPTQVALAVSTILAVALLISVDIARGPRVREMPLAVARVATSVAPEAPPSARNVTPAEPHSSRLSNRRAPAHHGVPQPRAIIAPAVTAVAFVPPGRREAMDRLIRAIQQGQIDATTLVVGLQSQATDLEVAPLQLQPLEVEPLQNLSSSSDSTK